VAVPSEPDRHALVLLDYQSGTCPPIWARRRGKSRRFTGPVTLAAALEREDTAVWPGMAGRHRDGQEELTAAADGLITVTARDDPARGRAGPADVRGRASLGCAAG
jgi:hypothetical protein